MATIDGIISGLDTASIIEGLVALQGQQVDRLTAKKTEIEIEQLAFQGVESRLFSLKSKMGQLNRTSGNSFSGRTVSSSHEDIITATGSSKASEGSYNLRVTSRARAHQVGSAGFSGSTAEITQGTFSLQVGDRPASEITIDGTNNTVTGLANAINTQSSDVSASIIHDQASGTDRLLLTSKYTGTDHTISITNNLAASSGTAVQPDFTGVDVQSAANATIQLGSGPGAIITESSTNKVDGLIQGVTLNLNSVDLDQDVTINVSRDTEAATTAVQEFVDEYNSLMEFINEQSQFDSETNEASPLLGNRNVAALKNELGSMMTSTVAGLESGLNRFSQIGIAIDRKGLLSFDAGKLSSVLNGEVEGIDPNDVPKLFGMSGKSTNAGIEFLIGTNDTKHSTNAIEVDITQVAERATVSAANSLAGSIVIDGSNKEIQLKVDGRETGVLQLSEGTYTQEQLANELQSVINAAPALGSHDVTVAVDGGKLNFTTDAYGSNASVTGFSGTALADLGLIGSETGVGVDVAGSFIVDGKTEVATGNGRVLIGDAENENTADLQLRVTLDQSQIVAGVEGEMTINRGLTSQLDGFLTNFLDAENGSFSTINEGFDSRIESIDDSIGRVNAISQAKTDYLIEQFAALERVLGELQSTSSFVSSQLGGQ
jgi:flagellar hook-associated protein 2